MSAQPKDQHATTSTAAGRGRGDAVTKLSRTESAERYEALDSRIVIEQAKNAVSARHSTMPDVAFAMLRGLARSQDRDLYEYAKEVVAKDGRLDA
jgi:AmiR/NasT family two-component response regulator